MITSSSESSAHTTSYHALTRSRYSSSTAITESSDITFVRNSADVSLRALGQYVVV